MYVYTSDLDKNYEEIMTMHIYLLIAPVFQDSLDHLNVMLK